MVNDPSQRPSPEQLLARVEHEERLQKRGRLKIFLGYASGVGKSFQMLDEGRRRHERGEDVVICAMQPHYSAEVQPILQKLPVIPPLKIDDSEVIDVEAVLRRNPQVALVDGLAYDNPPGSRNPHRWQDVVQILEAGISVNATVNIHYLEKLRDQVEQITGRRASCTIPPGFLDNSDELVVVDAPAIETLTHEGPRAESAELLAEELKLSRLRELALLVAAGVVDHQLENYLRSHGIDQAWGVQERILVCVTPRSNALRMLQSGRRNADRFHGELYAVYVRQPALTQKDQDILEQNLSAARDLGAQVETLNGLIPVDAIVKFAKEKGITQIFIGHTMREGAWRRLWSDLIERLIRSAEGIDVIVFPH
jgi:two-component system sensor histidine kinase KdpD